MPMQAAMSKHNLAYESEHWVLVQQSENGKMSRPADSPQSWSTNNAVGTRIRAEQQPAAQLRA